MSRFKKIISIVIPIILILILAIHIEYGWQIGAYFNPESTTDDIVELAALVSEQIDMGLDEGRFYIKDISLDQIARINEYIVSLYGMVNQYSVLSRSKDGSMHILLRYELSDNYFVYQQYVNAVPIPDYYPNAKKLYSVVTEVLDKIIVGHMTDYEKELAIHDYIVANCSYGYVEYSQDNAYRAYGVLVQRKAVCNGYAEAFSLLLNCVGIENSIMTGYADDQLHAWNRVKIDNEWYQVDATWDDPIPDRGIFVGHMYFNVNDDIMSETHTWKKSDFEPCYLLEENYYVKNKYVCNYHEFKIVVEREALEKIIGITEVVVTDYKEDYDFRFIGDIKGIGRYSIGKPEKYGDNYFLTVYLNQ